MPTATPPAGPATPETFGDVVRRLAAARQPPITVRDLAPLANLHPVSLYEIVAGRNSPSLDTARAIARALGVGLAAFDACEIPPRGEKGRGRGAKEKSEKSTKGGVGRV